MDTPKKFGISQKQEVQGKNIFSKWAPWYGSEWEQDIFNEEIHSFSSIPIDYSIIARSYDLRGIYGVDIDEDFFFRLWYAFAKVSGKKNIALWYDTRLSSQSLKQAFSQWVHWAGATITDIGLCSSDMLSFATCYYQDIEAWVMITASHNPKEYNGMKCLNHFGEPYNLKKYGTAMIHIMRSMKEKYESWKTTKSENRDILEDWTNHIISFIGNHIDFSKYTIVVDGWNGVAGVFMKRLSEKLGCRLIPLFLDPDGNFPNHHPNPMLEKNRETARQTLLKEKADIAFCFDWDADRVMILDNKGDVITSGIISSIITKKLIKKYPWAGFIWNANVSHIFKDTVQSLWGFYGREMVWHVYIREHMMKNPNIVFAWEHSAHYFFRDNFFMDSGIMAGMVFLSVIVESKENVSEVVKHYKTYITWEETNFEVKKPKEAIEKLQEIYKNEKIDLFDGITVNYDDGSWWNFRPSSNEPLLRLNMEAKTQERYDELYTELMGYLRNF